MMANGIITSSAHDFPAILNCESFDRYLPKTSSGRARVLGLPKEVVMLDKVVALKSLQCGLLLLQVQEEAVVL